MKREIRKSASTDSGTGDFINDIIQAALDGNASLIEDLLQAGEDINTKEPDSGFTCLHIACLNGDGDVIDVLLRHNRKFGDLDYWAQTNNPPRFAWQLAMSAHHYDIANRVDAAANGDKNINPSGPKLVR